VICSHRAVGWDAVARADQDDVSDREAGGWHRSATPRGGRQRQIVAFVAKQQRFSSQLLSGPTASAAS
jgi:hypothetical protein